MNRYRYRIHAGKTEEEYKVHEGEVMESSMEHAIQFLRGHYGDGSYVVWLEDE